MTFGLLVSLITLETKFMVFSVVSLSRFLPCVLPTWHLYGRTMTRWLTQMMTMMSKASKVTTFLSIL